MAMILLAWPSCRSGTVSHPAAWQECRKRLWVGSYADLRSRAELGLWPQSLSWRGKQGLGGQLKKQSQVVGATQPGWHYSEEGSWPGQW